MERFTTLFEWLDSGSSEAVVGLEQVDYQVHCLNTAYLHFTTKVTEYRSGEAGEKPYYHCKLDECKDEQGNAEQMKTHLFTLRHKQAGRENKSSQISDIANCSKKGPYYRDRVSIGTFLAFWVPFYISGSLFSTIICRLGCCIRQESSSSIRASLARRLPSSPRTSGKPSQEVLKLNNCIPLLRRDYTVMGEVVDRELWEKCRKGRMTRRRMEEPAPRKREVKEEGSYQEWKRKRRREEESGLSYNDERRGRGNRDDDSRRERFASRRDEEYSWTEGRPQGGRRREDNHAPMDASREFKKETDRGYREREIEDRMGRNRLGEGERLGSSIHDISHFSNDSGRGSADGYNGGPAYHDDGLEEVGRSGNFSNWKTAVVKRDVERREEQPSTSVLPPEVARGEEEDIDRLHK